MPAPRDGSQHLNSLRQNVRVGKQESSALSPLNKVSGWTPHSGHMGQVQAHPQNDTRFMNWCIN